MSTSKFSVFLFRNGMDCLSKALLVPWIMTYINYCRDTTWTDAVLSYGSFYCSMKVGALCGAYMQNDDLSNSKFALILLALSYGGLAMTTRISLLLVFSFIIGYAGAMVTASESKFNSNRSKSFAARFSSNSLSATSAVPTAEVGNEMNAQRRIIIFSFAVLFSGLVWREGEHVYSVSLKMPSLLMTGFCLFVYIVKSYVNQRGRPKPMTSIAGSAMPSQSSQDFKRSEAIGMVAPSQLNALVSELEAGAAAYAGGVPLGFLKLFRGKLSDAQKAYAITLKWREINKIDDMVTTPQPFFHEILRLYPHAIHGKSKDNCIVLYEVLGKARPKELAQYEGFSTDNLVAHFMLRNEFCFQKLMPPAPLITSFPTDDSSVKEGQIMTILDVKGVSVSEINADVISFIKKSSEIMDAHYPGRVCRLIICNAPFWFYSVWSVVANVLSDSVKKKISIISGTDGLAEFIEKDQRPADYGGTSKPLGQAEEHIRFVELASAWGGAKGAASDGTSAAAQSSCTSAAAKNSDSSASSQAGQRSGGFMGWMRNRMSSNPTSQPSSSAYSSGTTPATNAFLGEKNMYRYDKESGSWIIGLEEDEQQQPSAKKMTREQLEEHGLVLAIQAAHVAAMEKKDAKVGGFDSEARPVLYVDSDFDSSSSHASAFGSSAQTNAIYSQPLNSEKLSVGIFLLATGSYFITCFVESCVMTMLPVWMATNRIHGGLGYNVLDISYVLSGSAFLLYISHILFIGRLVQILRVSPVRALRMACGAFVILAFLFPSIMRLEFINADYHNSSVEMPVAVSNSPNELLSDVTNTAHYVVTSAVSQKTIISNRITFWSPTASLLAIPLPAFFISGLVAMTYCCRKASGMLLYFALLPSFQSPTSFVSVVSGFADVLGPLIGSALFCLTYHLEIPFPMDASFILSICSCLCSLLYACSLFINVQFRGDFGIISDMVDASRGMDMTPDSFLGSNGPRTGPGRGSPQDSFGGILPTECIDSIGNCVGDIFDVPIRDLSLLLSPPASSYGSRMQSVSIDLKEV